MQIASFMFNPANTRASKAEAPANDAEMPTNAAPVARADANDSGRQTPDDLKSAIGKLAEQDPSSKVAIDDQTNAVTFVGGSVPVKLRPGADGSGPDRIARNFMFEHGQLFGITDAKKDLQLISHETDELGMAHSKYQQVWNGLPVFDQQVVVHSKDTRVTAAGGRTTPNIQIAGTAHLNESQATRHAIHNETRKSLEPLSLQPGGKSRLGVYTKEDGTPVLAYEMTLESTRADGRWRLYVDANTGDVIDRWSLIETMLVRETYDAKSSQSRPGKIARREGDGPVSDEVINKAHDNAGAVYDYYKSMFNRDGIDGKGMKIVSTVHYGSKYNNAFWDGSQMTYGDGDGERFISLGNALDVVGHEMAHGVTERTAGLRYFKQSGALNESWSDVFGNLIERWDWERKNPGASDRDPNWMVGESIFTPKIDGDALRSMKDPGTAHPTDPQPGHMKDYKNTASDNGGVHINSGIPNRAAYEIAQKIGADKLSQIWYRALTKYMTSGSQFTDAANFTVQAARDLFGAGSVESSAVRDGWLGVGLTPSAPA